MLVWVIDGNPIHVVFEHFRKCIVVFLRFGGNQEFFERRAGDVNVGHHLHASRISLCIYSSVWQLQVFSHCWLSEGGYGHALTHSYPSLIHWTTDIQHSTDLWMTNPSKFQTSQLHLKSSLWAVGHDQSEEMCTNTFCDCTDKRGTIIFAEYISFTNIHFKKNYKKYTASPVTDACSFFAPIYMGYFWSVATPANQVVTFILLNLVSWFGFLARADRRKDGNWRYSKGQKGKCPNTAEGGWHFPDSQQFQDTWSLQPGDDMMKTDPFMWFSFCSWILESDVLIWRTISLDHQYFPLQSILLANSGLAHLLSRGAGLLWGG